MVKKERVLNVVNRISQDILPTQMKIEGKSTEASWIA